MHDSKARPYVYVVRQDDTIAQQSEETGEMTGGNWLVAEGLVSGDRVVVNGLQDVRTGMKVKPVAADTNDTPDASKISLSMTDPAAQ